MSRPAEAASVEQIDWSQFDFIDLGCSRGGSVRHSAKRFGGKRGLGLDLDPRKVVDARVAGVDAVVADVTSVEVENQVRFVSMMDFLEHLPNLEMAEEVIRNAARAATDFLFIFHPSFEGEDYLGTLDLRQYWWHWRGHTCHLKVADYCSIFERLGLNQYMIRYIQPVENSRHPSILPSGTPIDQQQYDEERHGPKPEIEFPEPLWRAQEIFVALKQFPEEEWKRMTKSRPEPR